MNVVMDEAAEVYVKDAKPRRELGKPPPQCSTLLILAIGRIFLKGDNITLVQQVI
jgi:small nuclear ribonucleoprotein (snRNP)-like protein